MQAFRRQHSAQALVQSTGVQIPPHTLSKVFYSLVLSFLIWKMKPTTATS